MKNQKTIHSNSHRGLLLVVPVICSMAFTACSDVSGSPGTHQTINFQSALTGRTQSRDYVTIGARAYNPETKSFDRPWPFGPEGGAQ